MPQIAVALVVGAEITASAIIADAIFIAAFLYSRQQAKKLKRSLKRLGDVAAEAQDRSFTAKQPAGPRRIIYGECRVGGNIVFIHTNGEKNEYIHLVIAVASHEVTSFSNLRFDDEVVPLSEGLATGRFAGYASCAYFYGSVSQTAIPTLLFNCPEVWTSEHRLRGIAGMYVRLKYNADLFPNGIPNITVVCKGKKVFDPRSSLTVWSNNSALCLADYLCDAKLGMGFDYSSEIDEPELIASANNCDELIPLAS
jgi:hypothetical protein